MFSWWPSQFWMHIIALDVFFNPKIMIFFLFLHENICCWYSLEAPRWGASNEYHNICFCWEIRKNIYLIPTLIDIYGTWCKFSEEIRKITMSFEPQYEKVYVCRCVLSEDSDQPTRSIRLTKQTILLTDYGLLGSNLARGRFQLMTVHVQYFIMQRL